VEHRDRQEHQVEATLGSWTFSDPVVANGLVWIGTNNHDSQYGSPKTPAAVLKCFRESDGEFLHQFVVLPKSGLMSVSVLGFNGSPLADGERLWFTTLIGDVHCLDIAPLLRGAREPCQLWKVDMPDEFGVFPRYPYMSDGKPVPSPLRTKIGFR
jgi:outer membrane protein assembly factor BamB